MTRRSGVASTFYVRIGNSNFIGAAFDYCAKVCSTHVEIVARGSWLMPKREETVQRCILEDNTCQNCGMKRLLLSDFEVAFWELDFA